MNQVLYIDEIQSYSHLTGLDRAESLSSALNQRLPDGQGRFIIDFSGVQVIDRHSYDVLVAAAIKAKELRRTLEFNRPPLQLVRMVEEAGQENLFGLTSESLEEIKEEFGVPQSIRHGLPIVVPASLGAIQVVRDVAVQLAQEMGFSEAAVADVELCVGEAAVNAVRYGSPHGTHDRLSVRFFQKSDRLIVQIRDSGKGFDPDRVPFPSAALLRENGLGIFLMRSLMDRVDFTHQPGQGMTVRMEKRLWLPSPTPEAPKTDPVFDTDPLLEEEVSSRRARLIP